MSTLKRMSLALCAALGLAAGSAQAIGDVNVVNSSSIFIHPYFKSNCWSSEFNKGADEWVFFGGIGPNSQFTWDNFYLLLDPKCRNPIVKFTYNLNGEAPPHETIVERTVVLHYDAMENTRIRLGNEVVVQSVAPY